MTARIFQFLPVILLLILISCEQMGVQPDADNTPPKARLGPSMVVDSTRPVILNASRSSDAEDMPDFLEFRWDLNGDGIWDTEFKAYPYLVKYFPVPGTYHIRMEVTDRHGLADQDSMTVKTYGFNNDTARFVDPRDGQSYPMVKLAGVWWMAENLNFGQMIPDTQLSRNNGIYEKYCYQNDPNFKGPSG
ncbi:MAG: PKD domain-containing protein, partial [Bacteroidales bacterium]